MFDYKKLKTPFFIVSIYDSLGKRKAVLPDHLLKLVDKIEIFEAFGSDNEHSTLNITFVEGSREPANTDPSLGTQGLFKIPNSSGNVNTQISGSITNRSGSVLDLRFSGTSGITFLTKDEQTNGTLSSKKLETVDGKKRSRTHNKEDKSPTFLFQERNQIEVSWGYIEEPKLKRSFRGYIKAVKSTFPDNGMPVVNIFCSDTGSFLNQFTGTKGISLGTVKSVNIKNGSVLSFEDTDTSNLVESLAKKLGLPFIVSNNFPAPKLDKDKQKIFLGGTSLEQFFRQLAKEHNAYYKTIPDPKTGVDTIIFLSKQDFESSLVIKNKSILEYKGLNSILKSVSINADFSSVFGADHSGTDSTGERTSESSEEAAEIQVTYATSTKKPGTSVKTEQLVDLDPTGNNKILACTKAKEVLFDNSITGTMEMSPVEDAGYNEDKSKIDAEKASRSIALEIETVGYPGLTPGVVEIKGIGVRYSGKYRLQTVTHTIDANGYNCRAVGLTYTIPNGGIDPLESSKIPDQVESVTIQTYENSVTRPSTNTNQSKSKVNPAKREELNKLLGIPKI